MPVLFATLLVPALLTWALGSALSLSEEDMIIVFVALLFITFLLSVAGAHLLEHGQRFRRHKLLEDMTATQKLQWVLGQRQIAAALVTLLAIAGWVAYRVGTYDGIGPAKPTDNPAAVAASSPISSPGPTASLAYQSVPLPTRKPGVAASTTNALAAPDQASTNPQAKVDAQTKAQAQAVGKAEAVVQAKALEHANAKSDALAKALEQARAEAQARAVVEAKLKTDAQTQVNLQTEAKVKADALARAEVNANAKALEQANAKADALAKALELARAEAKAEGVAQAKALEQARAEAKASAQTRTMADVKPKAQELAKAPAPNQTMLPTAPPTKPTQAARDELRQIDAVVRQWAKVWAAGEVDQYIAMYSESFVPDDRVTRSQWEKIRRQRVGNARGMAIDIRDLTITQLTQTEAQAVFVQNYLAVGIKDQMRKILILEKTGDQWRIASERAASGAGQ